jgi:hypothetical protein
MISDAELEHSPNSSGPARSAGLLRVIVCVASLWGMGVACVPTPEGLPIVATTAEPVEFTKDVKPVLDRRCVVCHSCYNAACQLKLSSFEGIDRGGSKIKIYDSGRLRPIEPTRLFVDEQTTPEWRERGFFSVRESRATAPLNDSLLFLMLEGKRFQPTPSGEYRAEASDLTCPADSGETARFLRKHPGRGMPFGFPALSVGEHQILESWLATGAKGPDPRTQQALVTPTPADAEQILKWEAFLNRPDPKHAMTARYLYEHFFLAHLLFTESGSGDFFELARSSTPTGEPIDVIATVRPYDDPGVDRVFYRFRKIHSTIVHKTHMAVELDDARMARYRELFIDPEWLSPPRILPHSEVVDANPFVVYAQIPPSARYGFLLEHSAYIIKTFMQGPVCKGQIALNVIHDHFWVFFMDPEQDLAVRNPEFLIEQAGNLRLPNEQGSQEAVVKAFSDKYRERYAAFYKAKMELYDQQMPGGLGLESVWRGRVQQDNPLLTIYRHFDSASLHLGPIGGLPRTLWLIDYAQLERIYYSLVAGFDIYGNLAHQVNVRRYMDYLRVEGELNFVQLLPQADREPTIRSWYVGEGALEATRSLEILRAPRKTRVNYETDDSKRELVERLVDEHLMPSLGIQFDSINFSRSGEETRMPSSFDSHEDVLDGFRALTAPGTGFIREVNGSEANLLWLRVRGYEGEDRFISIVINRWHDNVNSLLLEKFNLNPAKDSIDFHAGPIGSYPNYFLDVTAEEIPDFFDMLENFDGSDAYRAKLDRYGVNRADPAFWPLYDWFQARADEANGIHAGVYDLNRYYPVARE